MFYHEFHFFNNLPKNDKRAKCFGLTFRYIDDLLSINNKYFKQCIPSIYPSELELKETTENTSECSYLDIMMFNDDGELKFKLYDKRDQFQFGIVNYPHMDSNIPIGPAYGVYVSRLIAFARVCTGFEDFEFRHTILFDKLVKQGFSKKKLKNSFLKFVDKHKSLLKKYKEDLRMYINEVVSEY